MSAAPPRVALVHDNFVGPTGMGLMAQRLARSVLEWGWELTVVGSRVPSWLRTRCEVRLVRDWPSLPAVPRHLAWCAAAARELGRVKVDLVHVHSPLLGWRADVVTSHFMAQPAFARGVREHRAGVEGLLRRGQERLERSLDHLA
jgi:hypothetical protein